MKRIGRLNADAGQPREWDAVEPELRESLNDFRASVHAWSNTTWSNAIGSDATGSEAARNRSRTMSRPVVRRAWRSAAGWALAAVLLAAAVSGGLYQRHQRQQAAQIAAQRAAVQQRELAAQRAGNTEDLLANVDSDISREVPSALEPLASLMTDNGNE